MKSTTKLLNIQSNSDLKLHENFSSKSFKIKLKNSIFHIGTSDGKRHQTSCLFFIDKHIRSKRMIPLRCLVSKVAYPASFKRMYQRQFTVDSNSLWLALSGFSRYSVRKDLNMLLGDIKPSHVDAVLDPSAAPLGQWIIQLNASDLKPLQSRIIACKELRVTIKQITEAELNNMTTATRFGITPSTLRIRNLPQEIGEEELRFFFQGYKLRKDPFSLFTDHLGQRRTDFLFVHFESPDEAFRAYIQKNNQILLGKNIVFISYRLW